MPIGRDGNGKFAKGNPGGPGRPRRAIESQYLATLADAVGLDDWQEIVVRAIEDAKAGDKAAREWIAKYVLGNEPMTLVKLAAMEYRSEGPEQEVANVVRDRQRYDEIAGLWDSMDDRGVAS